MNKLNKNAKKWVKALRSGKYKQTNGQLTALKKGEPVAHCCLGILCELAVADGVEVKIRDSVDTRTYDGNGGVPPDAVMKWAGLRHAAGDIIVQKESSDLTELNDTQRKSFKQIARVIEQKAKELFV